MDAVQRQMAVWRRVVLVAVAVVLLLVVFGPRPGGGSTSPSPAVDPGCRDSAAKAYAAGQVATIADADSMARLCTMLNADQQQREQQAKRSIDATP